MIKIRLIISNKPKERMTKREKIKKEIRTAYFFAINGLTSCMARRLSSKLKKKIMSQFIGGTKTTIIPNNKIKNILATIVLIYYNVKP